MSLLAHSFDLINSLPTDIPDPGPVAPPGFAGPVAVIMGWVKWVGLIVAVLGVIIIGAKLAINVRRGEAAGELGEGGDRAVAAEVGLVLGVGETLGQRVDRRRAGREA